MSRRSRTFRILSGASLLALAAPGVSAGCNPTPAREEPPVDCTAADAYEFFRGTDSLGFSTFRDFEATEEEPEENEWRTCPWYEAVDDTGLVNCDHPLAGAEQELEAVGGAGGGAAEEPLCDGPRRAVAAYACETIPDGPRCGSETALRLTAEHNNDWGSLWGDFRFASDSLDVSEYDGIAFWARAEPGTQRAFTVLLNDKYTANIELDATLQMDLLENSPDDPRLISACVNEEVEGQETGTANPTPGVQIGGSTVPGYVPSEDACGNSYDYILEVSNRWEFYVLPFDEFRQEPLPNRRLEGLDRTSFRGMIIRAPKDVIFDLWIDDLGLYRRVED